MREDKTMDNNYTHITICLDRSGSMVTVQNATIDGFNEFMGGQRAHPGKLTLSLVGFDDAYETWLRMGSADYVLSHQTFVPRGMTSLRDAMGRSIVETGADLAALPEAERPGKVLYVLITDGHDNSSREYTVERVNQLVKTQQDKFNWTFFFLGANQDAILTARSYGISRDTALTYSAQPDCVRHAFRGLSGGAAAMRAGKRPAFGPSARAAAMGPRKQER
jgi:hypothetical protein